MSEPISKIEDPVELRGRRFTIHPYRIGIGAVNSLIGRVFIQRSCSPNEVALSGDMAGVCGGEEHVASRHLVGQRDGVVPAPSLATFRACAVREGDVFGKPSPPERAKAKPRSLGAVAAVSRRCCRGRVEGSAASKGRAIPLVRSGANEKPADGRHVNSLLLG